MFGASTLTCGVSRMSQPTEAQRIAPGASKDARYAHPGIGWALSSHSIKTSGQEVTLALLTLSTALQEGRLEEFADLAEARIAELGFPFPQEADVEEAVRAVIKVPQPEDQTSRSLALGSSPGK